MNAEYKQRWLEALRSGEYEQGKGMLRYGSEFCCLGVLCDLVDQNGWGRPDGDRYHFVALNDPYEEMAIAQPPSYVIELVGLDTSNIEDLIRLNDVQARKFDFIANWIEENL